MCDETANFLGFHITNRTSISSNN
uniref:Uncharacterized protein n=1 Tax=Arundo donax TaxID=35708 RepID=A0A0A9C085_ARUDO